MKPDFFSLAWREAIRSAYWGKSLATSIGLGLLGLYFSANFLFLGFAISKILREAFPDTDPVSKFNSFVLGYLAIELIIRQLMQKLPVISFKPFLIQNIRRRQIVNYLMVRSVMSFFNLLPLFLVVPVVFTLVGPANGGLATAAWFFSLLLLVFGNHFLSIYLKWRFNDNEFGFFIVLGVLGGLFALNHFNILDLSGGMGKLMDTVLIYPALAILFFVFPLSFYLINYRFLISRLYVNLVSQKSKREKIRDYSWLDGMGETGRFIALELRLIWRNKRPRSVAMLSLIFLAYGFLIYQPKGSGHEIPEFLFIIGGIMLVGLFSVSYGQFFPAWHSNYFSMLMCQRLKMRQFLLSFYMLVTVISVVCYLLTLPYALLQPKIVYTHLAMLLYNLGVNIPFLFFIGLFSKKRLDLNQSSVMNYQGVGASQWLAGLPIMLAPVGLFYLFKLVFGTLGGYVGLAALGLVGILIHRFVIDYFSTQYLLKKHQMIANYKNS